MTSWWCPQATKEPGVPQAGAGSPQTPSSVPFFLRQQPLGLFCGLSPGHVAVTGPRCPSHLHRHRGCFSCLALHTSEVSLRKFCWCLCFFFFFNVGYFLTSEGLWVFRVGGKSLWCVLHMQVVFYKRLFCCFVL